MLIHHLHLSLAPFTSYETLPPKSDSLSYELNSLNPIHVPDHYIVSKELIVYTRRRQRQGKIHLQPAQTQKNQESNPPPIILENPQGKATFFPIPSAETFTNLDRPIAKRKGVCSSTLHSLHNYMTYSNSSLHTRHL